MFQQAVRISLARHYLGLASVSDIVDGAHSALDGGIYSASLGEIITVSNRNQLEMNRLFAQSLLELEIPTPTATESIRELSAGHLVPLSEGLSSPSQTCERCHQDYVAFDHDWWPQMNNHKGQIHWGPIRTMVDFHYTYDQPGEWHERTDAECLEFALEWSRAYWRTIRHRTWLTQAVKSIAAAIYADRAFDRLPILADALEEAGCTNADVLLHCRQPEVHVCGCWVVDLVLGKE